jgi:hypothetical protein
VRRAFAHRRALARAGVAGAHRRANLHVGQALALQFGANPGQRFLEVDADVVGQRLERRDVHHAAALRQRAALAQAFTHQLVDGGEEGGEGLARAGGRGHQGRAASANRRPGADLSRRRHLEHAAKPGRDRRMERLQYGAGLG